MSAPTAVIPMAEAGVQQQQKQEADLDIGPNPTGEQLEYLKYSAWCQAAGIRSAPFFSWRKTSRSATAAAYEAVTSEVRVRNRNREGRRGMSFQQSMEFAEKLARSLKELRPAEIPR